MAGQDVIIRFIAETKGFDLSKLQAELAETQGYTEALNTGMRSLKALTLAMGGSMLAQVLPMVMGSKAVADYNTNISIASGISKSLADNIDDVNSSVNAWAMKYGLTADDLSAGILEMTKADMDWVDIQENMDPIARLAVANNIEMADSLSMVVKAQSLWGEETYTSYEYANMLQVAAAASLMDVADLGDAIKASGSQASMAGVSYEEFLASAAALSNIGTELGYNWGSFFTRINTTKTDLAAILGDSSWILDDGNIDFTALLELLSGASDSQLKDISSKWGGVKTLGAAIQAATMKGKDYDSILAEITSDSESLNSVSDNMMMSIEASWTRLQEAFLAPLRDQDVMEAFATSLTSVATALTDPTFVAGLQTIMLNSADFVRDYGPKLVETVINLLEILVGMGPTLNSFAIMGTNILKMVSAIPAPVWEFIGGLYILNKILPAQTIPFLITFIQESYGLKFAAMNARQAIVGLAVGIGMVAAGATMLTSDEPIFKFLGALVIALGAATAAYGAFMVAKAMAMPANIAIMAAAGSAAVALLGGFGIAAAGMGSSTAPLSGDTAGYTAGTSGTGASAGDAATPITYIDSSTTINYQAGTDNVDVESRAWKVSA